MANKQSSADTVIADGVVAEGNLTSGGDIWVRGRFEGNLVAKNSLTIAAGGEVTATVSARDVVIAGRLKGNVKASDSLSLHAGAVLEGDVTTQQLLVAPGAQLNGRVKMTTDSPASSSVESVATKPEV